MKIFSVILAIVFTAACAGTAGLPTGPSAIVEDTITSASHGNPDQRIHVHVQVASSKDGASYFLLGVEVTIECELGRFSGVTQRKGTAEIDLPGLFADHSAVITLTKAGYWPVTANVDLSDKPQQIFQFAMASQ